MAKKLAGEASAYSNSNTTSPLSKEEFFKKLDHLFTEKAYNRELELIEENPGFKDNLEFWICKGRIFEIDGNWRLAYEVYKEGAEYLSSPDDKVCLWKKSGDLLYNSAYYLEASYAYMEIRKIQGKQYKDWLKEGDILKRLGKPENALQLIKTGIENTESENNKADLWFSLGELYEIYFINYKKAREAYHKAREIKRDFFNAWWYEGLVLKKEKKYADICGVYLAGSENVCLLDEKVKLLFARAMVLRDCMGNYKTGADAFHQIRVIKPDHYPSWWYEGECLEKVENHRKAISVLKNGAGKVLKSSEKAALWNALGSIEQNVFRNYKKAVTAYDKALFFQKNYFYAYKNKGLALLKMNKTALACDTFSDGSFAVKNSRQRGEILYCLAETLMKKRNFLEALKIFKEISEMFPVRKDEALNSIGYIYLNYENDYEKAEKAFNSALKINPRNVDVLRNKIKLLKKQGNYSDAALTYQHWIDIETDPFKKASVWNSLGLLFVHYLKDNQRALRAFKNTLKLKKDYPYGWLNKGLLLQNMKHFDEALSVYREGTRSIRHNDMKAEVWNALGQLEENHFNDYEMALNAYNQALKLQKNNPRALFYRAGVLEKLEQYVEARDAYETGIILIGSVHTKITVRIYNSLGLLLEHSFQDYPGAIEAFNNAIRLIPGKAEYWINKGRILEKTGHLAEAKRNYEKGIKHITKYIDRAVIWNALGVLMDNYFQDYDGAAWAYNEGIKCCDTLGYLWRNKGIILERIREFKKAQECFLEGCYHCPGDTRLLYALAYNLENYSNNREAALKYYAKVIRTSPEDMPGRLERGLSLAKAGRKDEALLVFSGIQEEDPYYLAACSAKARMLESLDKNDAALKMYNYALNIENHNIFLLLNKGLLLFKMKSFIEADKLFRQIITEYKENKNYIKNNPYLLYVVGIALNNLRMFNQAIALLKRAVHLTAANYCYHNELGKAYFYKHDYEKAANEFDKVLSFNPYFAEGWNNRAAALEYLNDNDGGSGIRYSLEKAIELDPSFFLAYRNLSNFYYRRDKMKEALDILNRVGADGICPDDFLSLKLKIETENRNFREARKVLDKISVNNMGNFYTLLWEVYLEYLEIEEGLEAERAIGSKKNYEGNKLVSFVELRTARRLFKGIIHKLEKIYTHTKGSSVPDDIKFYILFFLAYLYLKSDDILNAGDRLEEALGCKCGSSMDKNKRLLKRIYISIRDNYFHSSFFNKWLRSPTYTWSKRVIFTVLVSIVIGLPVVYPFFPWEIYSKIDPVIYIAAIIVPGVFLLMPEIQKTGVTTRENMKKILKSFNPDFFPELIERILDPMAERVLPGARSASPLH